MTIFVRREEEAAQKPRRASVLFNAKPSKTLCALFLQQEHSVRHLTPPNVLNWAAFYYLKNIRSAKSPHKSNFLMTALKSDVSDETNHVLIYL